MSEIKENTNIPAQQELPQQQPIPKYEIPAGTPPVEEIDRFDWSYGWQFQSIKQGLVRKHVSPDALHYLHVEEGFEIEPDQPEQQWREADAKAVGLRTLECPHCHGDNIVRKNFTGKVTKIKTAMPVSCRCGFYRAFYSRWLNPAMVPADYRNITMDTIEKFRPAFKSFPTEAAFHQLISNAKKYSRNCYLMVGPAGSGKTTLLVAMYHVALVDWCIRSFQSDNPTQAVWKINAPELSKQFRVWEMRDVGRDENQGQPTKLPEVMVSKVQAAIRAGYVPRLFLDELDKIKLDSEFQAREFSAIIDAIRSNGGQIVASTNLNEEALRCSLGDQFGPAIVRRLCGPRCNPDNPEIPADPERGGFLINFWRGTIEQNYEIPISSTVQEPKPQIRRGRIKTVWAEEEHTA